MLSQNILKSHHKTQIDLERMDPAVREEISKSAPKNVARL